MALLELRKVSFARGRRSILSDITFAVSAGESLAIVGPNGAGKSTLLNLMTGALQPQSGEVLFDGKPLPAWRIGELALRRAVLAQSTQVAFPYTVDETLRLSVPDKANKLDLKRHCQRAMRHVGIESYGHRILQELSGGEQQRVHLARVLVQLWVSEQQAGQMLFLDEPVSGLDLKHQVASMRLVQSLIGPSLATVAVIHDMNLALRFANRVICLEDGCIACDGPPEDCLTTEMLERVFGLPMARYQSQSGAVVISPAN